MKRHLLIIASTLCILAVIGLLAVTQSPAADLVVTAPTDGQHIPRGKNVAVTIASPALKSVLATMPGYSTIESSSPNDFAMPLKPEIVGNITVFLYAEDVDGQHYKREIPLVVDSALEDIASLRVAERVALILNDKRSIPIIGVTNHNGDTDLSRDSQVTIASMTPGVATVSREDGIWYVNGVDYGVAALDVSTQTGLKTRIIVEVGIPERRGDFNNDGQVNGTDEDILRRAIGRPANAGDPRDLNGDGIIDKSDVAALKSLGCASRVNQLIPGAKPATGCFLEYSLAGEAISKPPKCPPLTTQVCVDGAACDRDGKSDGVCAVAMRLTLNTPDSRLPKCKSNQISGYTIVEPSEKDAAKSAEDSANRLALKNALAGLGTLPIVGAVYTEELSIAVSLKRGKKGFKKSSKTLRLLAYGENGTKGSNALKLTCLPHP